MGNTVSSAEIAAAQIVGSKEKEFVRGWPRGGNPTECPWHRQQVKVVITVNITVRCGSL
jgi:hypothetical protein